MIAQKFPGWSLEYIDNLTYAQRTNIFAVLGAQAQHEQRMREKREARAKLLKRRR